MDNIIKTERETTDARQSPDIIKGSKTDVEQNSSVHDQQHTLHNLQIMLHSLPDIICSINAASEFVYVSAASEKILGYRPSELLQKKFSELVWNEDVERTVNMKEEIMKSAPVTFFENKCLHKNGSLVSLEWSATWNENDKLMYCIIKDVTERKTLENEQEKMLADIMQRNKNLEQFSYIISHNLRGPVANIIGLCDVIQHENLTPNWQKEIKDGLCNSATKLDDVITDLNSIMTIKSIAGDQKAMINFQQLVDDIRGSIEKQIDEQGAVIECDFSGIEEMWSLKSYLYSIFYNLITNSLVYRQPNLPPVMEIRSEHVENKIAIKFKDNGLGIDLDRKREQVFGLYKRFHTANEAGKGIGLYMVKMQVELIGGNISIESEVNKGTVFTIEFQH